MLRHSILFVSITIIVGAMPINASAQICDGILSWLCKGPTSPDHEIVSGEQTSPTNATATAHGPEKPPCLSLGEVHGGYPRYHIIEGRRCWYASARQPEVKSSDAKPTTETNINPDNDPLEHQPNANGAQATSTRVKNCEEQSLKLEFQEKRTFLKQCMSNKM